MKDYELVDVSDIENNQLKVINNENNEPDELKIEIITDIYATIIDKILLLIQEILIFIPGFISIMLYLYTLQGCTDSQFECIQKVSPSLVKSMLYVLVFSAFLFNAQLFLYVFKLTSVKQLCVLITIYIYICFYYDTGAYLDSHGAYNRAVLFIFYLNLGVFSNSHAFDLLFYE